MKHNETPDTVKNGVETAVTALVVMGMFAFFTLVGIAIVFASAWQ